MNRTVWWPGAVLTAALAAGLLAGGIPARAFELEPGVNNAGVIEYPTALDQFYKQTVHGTAAIFDLAKPDLTAENLRYGYQTGALQLLGDIFLQTRDGHENQLDYAEARAKLRILQFDEVRTSIAVGALARLTVDEAGQDRIEHRPYSFLGILTTELFPFENWGGLLANFYLDNRVGVIGLKGQLYHQIQAVAELDYFHSSERTDRNEWKGGLEIAGEGSFYFQLLYAERTEHAWVQIGVGF